MYPRIKRKTIHEPEKDLGLLTIEQLAERWSSKNIAVVRRRVKEAGIPVIRLSAAAIRFRLTDILKYEEACADRSINPSQAAGIAAMHKARAAKRGAK
jgi:hypothetical protein